MTKLFLVLKNAFLLPWESKRLVAEAMYFSIFNEYHLRRKVFRQIKPLHFNEPNNDHLTPYEIEMMRKISGAMVVLKKYAPWRPKCYNIALTAKKMLSKRNIKTSMHIGFRKKEEVLQGHAWLTYRGEVVTGFKKALKEYQPLPNSNFRIDKENHITYTD